jgi:hypothetical protein
MLAAPMDHLLLAASIALNTADAAPEPLEQQCAGHPLQERFLADRSRVRVLVTSRRTGKTVVLCVDAARTAARVEPGTWVLYVTKTRKNAKAVAWPEIKRVLRESGHAYTVNESDLTITISGGGSILLGGADKITEIEKYRGFNFALAIVDECGTYPSDLLESLRDEVLEPATIDTGGRMIFSGTPGPTLSGAWYEMSGPQASDVHRGTLMDNPHLMRHLPPEQRRAAIVDFLAEVRERNGWTEESPTYVREWLGEWAQDDSVLVFPFEPERNGWTPAAGPLGLPSHSTTGVLLAVQDWRAVVALDAGYTDANGYAVLATHPHRREVFVLETHKRRGQLIEAAAQEIRTLRERYTIDGRQPAVVVDAGGMGKIHAETLAQKYGLPVTPAEKREKASAISMLRDDILSSRLRVFAGPATDAIREEWSVLAWDGRREQIADGQDDHATDAAIYAHRYLRNYTRAIPAPAPEPGTQQWHQKERQKMIDEAQKRMRRRLKKGRTVA